MIVAIVRCELHLPQSGSLKSKRQVVHALVDRLHQAGRLSIAETDFHDLLQRVELGIAAVGTSERQLSELMDRMRRLVEDRPDAEILIWEPQFLEDTP